MTPGWLSIFAALALWLLGYPDQALKSSHEALTLARELSHPFSLAEALGYAAWLHQFRREGQAVQERAEAVIALSTEQGFPFWAARGTILRGWALVEQGQGRRELRRYTRAWLPRGLRGQGGAAVFSCPAGRGIWQSGAARRRA